MLIADAFTLVIPTFNRPILLNGLLDYFWSKAAKFEIAILDSSPPDAKALNRKTIERYNGNLDLRYVEFDETIPFLEKLNTQMRYVRTKYVSLCADDNIVLADAIEQTVATLEAQPDAVACHGLGLELILSGKRARLNIDNWSPSLDASTLLGRIYQLLSNFQSTIYATYRTEHLRRTLIESEQLKDFPFHWELFVTLGVLAGGKVIRLDHPSNVRRSFLPTVPLQWHPLPLICDDPHGFIADFGRYLDALIKFYTSQGISIGPQDKKLITQAHIVYCLKELTRDERLLQIIASEFARYAAPQA